MSRTTTTTMLAAAGSLALGLALGCTHPSHVKAEWGKAYHENVEAMVADPAAELENASEPAPQGMNAVTAVGVMQGYREPQASAPSLPLPLIVTDTDSMGSR
jgi:hypothetical protein